MFFICYKWGLFFVIIIEVFFGDDEFFFLCLVYVFEDNSNVYVYYDKKNYEDVGNEVNYCFYGKFVVIIWEFFVIWIVIGFMKY